MMACASFVSVVTSLLVLVSLVVTPVQGNGRLIDPVMRSSLWRFDNQAPVNYNDHVLDCGGSEIQHVLSGGRCGVCGDPYTGPRENEDGGQFATGVIVRRYRSGSVVTMIADLMAPKGGYFEVKLCPRDDPTVPVTQACLDMFPLKIVNGKGRRLRVRGGLKGDHGLYKMEVKLPKGVTCSNCVIQWHYHTATDYSYGNAFGCNGCGPQTDFYNCADVNIGYHGDAEASPDQPDDLSQGPLASRINTYASGAFGTGVSPIVVNAQSGNKRSGYVDFRDGHSDVSFSRSSRRQARYPNFRFGGDDDDDDDDDDDGGSRFGGFVSFGDDDDEGGSFSYSSLLSSIFGSGSRQSRNRNRGRGNGRKFSSNYDNDDDDDEDDDDDGRNRGWNSRGGYRGNRYDDDDDDDDDGYSRSRRPNPLVDGLTNLADQIRNGQYASKSGEDDDDEDDDESFNDGFSDGFRRGNSYSPDANPPTTHPDKDRLIEGFRDIVGSLQDSYSNNEEEDNDDEDEDDYDEDEIPSFFQSDATYDSNPVVGTDNSYTEVNSNYEDEDDRDNSFYEKEEEHDRNTYNSINDNGADTYNTYNENTVTDNEDNSQTYEAGYTSNGDDVYTSNEKKEYDDNHKDNPNSYDKDVYTNANDDTYANEGNDNYGDSGVHDIVEPSPYEPPEESAPTYGEGPVHQEADPNPSYDGDVNHAAPHDTSGYDGSLDTGYNSDNSNYNDNNGNNYKDNTKYNDNNEKSYNDNTNLNDNKDNTYKDNTNYNDNNNNLNDNNYVDNNYKDNNYNDNKVNNDYSDNNNYVDNNDNTYKDNNYNDNINNDYTPDLDSSRDAAPHPPRYQDNPKDTSGYKKDEDPYVPTRTDYTVSNSRPDKKDKPRGGRNDRIKIRGRDEFHFRGGPHFPLPPIIPSFGFGVHPLAGLNSFHQYPTLHGGSGLLAGLHPSSVLSALGTSPLLPTHNHLLHGSGTSGVNPAQLHHPATNQHSSSSGLLSWLPDTSSLLSSSAATSNLLSSVFSSPYLSSFHSYAETHPVLHCDHPEQLQCVATSAYSHIPHADAICTSKCRQGDACGKEFCTCACRRWLRCVHVNSLHTAGQLAWHRVATNDDLWCTTQCNSGHCPNDSCSCDLSPVT